MERLFYRPETHTDLATIYQGEDIPHSAPFMHQVVAIEARKDYVPLIVAAVNACLTISPDNPLQVAEGLVDVFGAAQGLLDYLVDGNGPIGFTGPAMFRLDDALAKARGDAT